MQRKLVKSYLMEYIATRDWDSFMCALQSVSINYTVMSLVDERVLKALDYKSCKR